MSRVENMFGPRESWGQGDEMAAVRERAVRQEGSGRRHPGSDSGLAPGGSSRTPTPTAKRGDEVPPQSLRDSAPIPAGQGSRGAKETKKAGFNRGGGAWGGLAGFVSIRCEGCGKVVNTCLRERTPVFRCKGCGHETGLEKVSNIHMHCARCGFTGKYRTNRTEKEIQMECLNCSDIVYLTRIRRGNYVPEAEATE